MRSIVTTNGCFDLFHAGHLYLLQVAATLGDTLVVLVNDDDSVRRLKGPDRPLLPLQDRMELLDGLHLVDLVIPFSDPTPVPALEFLRPAVHVKGGDYKPEDLPERFVVQKYGGRIYIAELMRSIHTSDIIAKIRG